MPLKIDQDIALPDKLTIGIPPEIFNFVKENIAGIHYIVIKRFLARNQYTHKFRIDVQEKPQQSQRPEYSADDICRYIYTCLQYLLEEEDAPGKYFIQIFRVSDKGNITKSKHVIVGMDEAGTPESNTFDPSRVDGDLLSAQFQYIQMLQDELYRERTMISQVISPIIDMNKELQKNQLEMGMNLVKMKEIEYYAEYQREQQRIEAKTEMLRIEAKTKKFNEAMKMIGKTGAVDRVAQILMAKMGAADAPLPPKQEKPKPTAPVKPPEKEMTEKEMMEELEKGLRERPLLTHIELLRESIKVTEGLEETLEDELSSTFYENLIRLLNSQSEDDAKVHLRKLKGEQTQDDLSGLMEVYEKLNDTQKKIVGTILSFEV